MFSEIFDQYHKGTQVWGNETICELHREIYDLLVLGLHNTNAELLNKIIPILERAYICGIKMNRKMIESKCAIVGWEKHLNKNDVDRIRRLRKSLVEELERIRDCSNGNQG